MSPRIKFINTRHILTDVCSEYLKYLGINHYVSINKATVGRDAKYLIIQRLSKCIDFCNKFKSLVVGRQEQLNLLEDFCVSRLASYVDGKFGVYTIEEKAICDNLKNLNLNYNVDFKNRNYSYSWLAGMLDGDGSIFITKTNRKCKYRRNNGTYKTYSYDKYLPVLKFTTESTAVYNNIIEIYNKLNVNFFKEEVKSKVSKKLGRNLYKVMYNITVTNFNDLLILLDKLDEKLIAKQKQAVLLKNFIFEKQKCRFNTKNIISIYNEIKELNTNF
jgi:hypothetical protein